MNFNMPEDKHQRLKAACAREKGHLFQMS
ncbi:hypothetical protein LNP05_30010 [Klebsiella pneumoniae subsp. pneumoniae]|nr:hypothetical protein [Klebsiella pneumoniae subsp. pneumoniae]